jgi:flagellar protein FliO/FliZ
MNPKTKILIASAVLLVLGAAASIGGMNAALVARVALGSAALAGFAWWYAKGRHAAVAGAEKPRLQVIARTGLSQRTGLALVEVDGKALLVVHGDGFAEVHPSTARRQSKRRSFKAALRSVS